MKREEADALIAEAKANWSEVRMCDSWDEPVATLFRLATLGASVAAPTSEELQLLVDAYDNHCAEFSGVELDSMRAALTALSNPEEQP